VRMSTIKSRMIKACSDNNVDSVKKLIAEGADVNGDVLDGYNPLMIALCHNRSDVARFLLTCDGLDCNIGREHYNMQYNIVTTMYQACDSNASDDIVAAIAGRSLHVNTKCYGQTPLHCTVRNKNFSLSLVLLGIDHIDVNIVSDHEETIVWRACFSGAGKDLVSAIAHKTSDININKKCGNSTPIMIAVYRGNSEAVRVLGTMPRVQWSREELIKEAR